MKIAVIMTLLLGGLVVGPAQSDAHCDSLDGPVATAALSALDTGNVRLVLPYVPAVAEAELTAAYDQARVVRAKGTDAKALADRYFLEAAVRLHRAGENAPYTGLKPAGMDMGPAILAAERALQSGAVEPLLTLMSEEISHAITERFALVLARRAATKEPTTSQDVPAARERVSAELGFITYIEGIYLSTRSGGHAH